MQALIRQKGARLLVQLAAQLPSRPKHFLWSLSNKWLLPAVRELQMPAYYPVHADASHPLRSTLCQQAHFHSQPYHDWCAETQRPPRFHRKQWEFYFITRALREQGQLQAGARGLGFGVGREPLPALFARIGCDLVLTDLDLEAASSKGWVSTRQHANEIADLNQPQICPLETFLTRARFEAADMNAIPAHLREFDFCWSSCALEHLGSIEQGLAFIRNSLACLKPGGTAVHTTEFNVYSNSETLDHQNTVLFRRCDLERLHSELTQAGHAMEPLELDPGKALLDCYIDMPPYSKDKHLKLQLAQWVTTSVGIIVRKAA